MIKIENAVFPSADWMEEVIMGMRNPMNSWDKSDSDYCPNAFGEHPNCQNCWYYEDEHDGCTTFCHNSYDEVVLVLGSADKSLMSGLCKAGTDHRKFMRQMPVIMRIVAPLYWWKEFDTYKVGTVSNSCSTMHKIHAKKFDRSDFSMEHLIPRMKEVLDVTIANLNACRGIFLETNDKKWWWQMIQLLPSSYNQKRTVTLNYEILWNMYQARKDHKLDEWREFCKWIETIPYFKEITKLGEK